MATLFLSAWCRSLLWHIVSDWDDWIANDEAGRRNNLSLIISPSKSWRLSQTLKTIGTCTIPKRLFLNTILSTLVAVWEKGRTVNSRADQFLLAKAVFRHWQRDL